MLPDEAKMISVVIPTHNRIRQLKRCLRSLLSQSYEDYEIMVSANRCTDGTLAYVRKRMENDDRIRLAITSKRGINIARNAGIKESAGELIAFIDDDAVAEKDWLKNASRFYSDSDHKIYGGRITNLHKKNMVSRVQQAIFDLDKRKDRQFSGISGSNMFIHKSIFDKHGLFDEDYVYGASETDFFYRCRKERFGYDGSIVVYHGWRKSLFDYMRASFRMGRSHGRYNRSIGKPFKRRLGRYWVDESLRLADRFSGLEKLEAFSIVTLFKLSFLLGRLRY